MGTLFVDNSSTDVEGGRASDITAVSHKNVREKYSKHFTPNASHILIHILIDFFLLIVYRIVHSTRYKSI